MTTKNAGVSNPNRRLTERQVLEIARAEVCRGDLKGIAERYGVSLHTIHAIRCGQRWASVTRRKGQVDGATVAIPGVDP